MAKTVITVHSAIEAIDVAVTSAGGSVRCVELSLWCHIKDSHDLLHRELLCQDGLR